MSDKITTKSTEMSDRITKIRAELCHNSNTEFASRINKSTHYASALCRGASNPGKNMLEEILAAFPDVSRGWLYFVLVGDNSRVNMQQNVSVNGDNIVNSDNARLTAIVESQQVTIREQAETINKLTSLLSKS